MALPATSTPFSQWQFDHIQPDHRNSPHGQKRSVSDRDENDLQNPINSFKRLRIHHAPLAQRIGRVSYRHASSEDHHEIDAYHSPQEQDQPQTTPMNNLHIYESTLNGQPHEQSPHTYPEAPLPPPPPQETENNQTHLNFPHKPYGPLLSTDFRHSYTSTPPPRPPQPNLTDYMPLDSHPNTVIIHDLDAEVAEIEAAEAAARVQEQEAQEGAGYEFVLPDEVERDMRGVPAHVLRGGVRQRESSALVLYRPPVGLSLDSGAEEMGEGQTMKRQILEEKRRREKEEQQQQQQQGQADDVDMAQEVVARNDHHMEVEREAEGWSSSRRRRENTPWPLNIRNWASGGNVRPLQEDIEEEREDDWDCDAMDIE